MSDGTQFRNKILQFRMTFISILLAFDFSSIDANRFQFSSIRRIDSSATCTITFQDFYRSVHLHVLLAQLAKALSVDRATRDTE